MNNKSKKVGLAVLAPLTMIIMSGAVLAQQDPMITFRFDDGLIGQYGYARPILAKYDFPAVDYIFTDPLEEGDWIGYMNWSQVEELQNVYGWEIGGHTKSHPHLTKLSDSKLIEELSESKAILESHGLLIKGFASPFGEYDDRVLSYIARYYENHGSAWPYDFNTYPFNDYAIVVQEARNSTSVATAKGWIDEAASSGKWLVLLFHEIVQSNPSEYEYTKDNFEAVVDYVKAKDIPVVTITDALKILSPNLALNHSFESATSGWADNWERTSTNNITLDTENNGCSPNSKNSIKFTGGTSTYSLYTKDFIDIDPTKVYLLKTYFNCQNFNSGSVNVLFEEYDSSGNQLNYTWQADVLNNYVGYKTTTYTPNPNVAKLIFRIESAAGSDLTCYVDNIVLVNIRENNSPNNSPILTAEIPDQSFNEDTSLTNAFDLDNYFSDPDKDPLIYSYSGATNIMVSINLDGTVDFSASPNWSGVESITLTASDGLLTAQDTILVTVVLANPSLNLILNPGFESATSGWADNWERTSTSNITLDTENNGCSPNSKNSIKFTGGTSTYSLYTKDFIDIDPTKVYPLKVFFNCSSFTSGGVDVFIDEYDSSGNWFSWKWQTGIWSPYVGYQIIAYVPSQNTDKILVWIEGVAKSNLTCYVDDVVLEGDSLPTPNNSPILTAEIPDQSFNEDTSLTNAFDLDNYFSDPDKDPLIYSYSGATNIMVSINLDGTVDFSASPNWSGVESITLTASDGLLTAQDTILVTVNPINDAPTITSTPGLIATTGVEYLYDIEVVDPDGDTITYSLTVYPAGMIIDANTGLISWIPSSDQIGDHNVKTEVSDGFLPDTQNWTIAVSETPVPNNSPILIQNIPDQSFDEDTTLINVFDLDDYFSDPDGDSLNYSASGANNITATINPDGTVDFSASQDWNGQENITFAASDGSLSAQDTILVTVNPVDDKPTIISTPGTAAIQDLEYVYDVEAADADGDVLVYSLITSPAGMIIDANTGLINWTPTADQLGDHNVEVKVSDGFLDDNQNWTITVSEESQNLVLNPSFEEVTNNWADYWERLDSQNIILDANNNGAAPNPKNSLKFIGGSQTYSVYAKEFIEVDPTKTYLFKAYFNCQNFTSGGVDIFFDEHDQSGNWLDWTWQTGIWNSYVGQKSVIYTPNPNTKKLLIWIEGVAGSNLTCYVDNIILEEQS